MPTFDELRQFDERPEPACPYRAAIDYISPIPLFGSGGQAADHGQADIADPPPAALAATAKIVRRRSDIHAQPHTSRDQRTHDAQDPAPPPHTP